MKTDRAPVDEPSEGDLHDLDPLRAEGRYTADKGDHSARLEMKGLCGLDSETLRLLASSGC